MNTQTSHRLVATLVALSMLAVTMPAMATHNSIGHQIQLADPMEVDGDGNLDPDIDPEGPYHQLFHESIEDVGLPARQAPVDQSGLRYDTSICNGPDSYLDEDSYDEGLRQGDACYVGYFDYKKQYQYDTIPLLLPNQPDHLYAANPSQGDDHCQGEGGEPITGDENVDPMITSLERRILSLDAGLVSDEDQCNWTNHRYNVPAEIAIDMALLEAPLMTAAEAQGHDTGSGTWTLPLTGTTYLFIFGQPHPDVVPDGDERPQDWDFVEDGRFVAGQGPFGTNPVEFGNPLFDSFENACGDRTADCQMLTPTDIMAYDPWKGDEDTPEPEQARVCGYIPAFNYAPAGNADEDRDQGMCGVTGTNADQFRGDVGFGGFDGFGVVDDAPPTWVTNLPGWQWGVIHLYENELLFSDHAAAYLSDDPAVEDGFVEYWVINPHDVPTDFGPLRCVTPNFIAAGDNSQLPSGYEDPGVYGTYEADAIDAEVYPFALTPTAASVVDATHEDVRSILGPAQDAQAVAQDAASDGVDLLVDVLATAQAPEDVQNGVDEADDRTDYLESSHTPAHALPGDDNQKPFSASIPEGLTCDRSETLTFNWPNVELTVETTSGVEESFTVRVTDFEGMDPDPLEGDDVTVVGIDDVVEAGATPDISLSFEEGAFDDIRDALFEGTELAWVNATYTEDGATVTEETWIDGATVDENGETAPETVTFPATVSGDVPLEGGLSFQASVNQETENIKDPTLLDGTLPEAQSETDEGYWQPDAYSFSGESIAYIDYQQSGQRDSCPGANPSAGDDRCPWRPLWDAYNTNCENFAQQECGDLLIDAGYNINNTTLSVDPGVGLYFVLEVTGPVIVSTALDNMQPLMSGEDETNCMVGTSTGFDAFLPYHLGLENPGEIDEEDRAGAILSKLCEGYDEANTAFFPDAFGNQDGTDRGFFSATFEWIKLTPTPSANDFGAEDNLCVSGIWSVSAANAADADGSEGFLLDTGVHEFSHWQSLTTGTDTPEDRDACPHHDDW